MTTTDRCFRIALPIALLMLGACGREAGPTHATPAKDESTAAQPRAPAVPSHETHAPAFDVEVSLSPKAQARIAGAHEATQETPRETVIVAAEYFGEPSADAQARKVPGSENPWLTLHRREIELDGAGIAHFPAATLDAQQLAWTARPDEPQVNVNVYSGRRTSPDNLLDCDMFRTRWQPPRARRSVCAVT